MSPSGGATANDRVDAQPLGAEDAPSEELKQLSLDSTETIIGRLR